MSNRQRSCSEHRGKRRSNSNEAKVYVGNVPTDELSDQDLLDFFKPFGKVLDIRVYKRYLFVQFENVHQANQLIKKGDKSLTIKGHQLDILPSMNVNLHENKYSSQHFLSNEICQKKDFDEQSLNYEPPRKRFVKEKSHDENEFVHCQILLVNQRQKNYAEEISCYLKNENIRSSIEILDRDCSFDKAIENAKEDHYLYIIILTPFYQNQNLVSLHILHQQHQEYRNMKLEDCYERIIEDYLNSKSKENQICLNSDKLPLSMLLCLLADGKQLTENELDRILIYLLDKKAKLFK